MENTSENRQKKQAFNPSNHITIGLLAHVDAGKTTLSEAILYRTGSIRRMGRVDNQDAFLDTDGLERDRGITIFSKQAECSLGDVQVTLLDTPGHVDFSSEMERTLQVLDYAILIISGADGVQGHTRTLWKLLKKYEIPVFVFVNKMDQEGTDRPSLTEELKKRLDDNCIDFSGKMDEAFYENVAVCDEQTLEHFLETGQVEPEQMRRLILERKLFPCFFGSALKDIGVKEFLEGIAKYAVCPSYPESFGARVFKITRDEQGNRLTHMKITGGSLKARDWLCLDEDAGIREKVNQIRMYSGEKYRTVGEAFAGWVCAVTGPEKTYPGQGLGREEAAQIPILEPVLTYRMTLPEDCDPAQMLPKLRQLEEEDPLLRIVWNENLGEIQVQIMGEVQLQVLESIILRRFGIQVKFASGGIVYKETIKNSVEGVGHFEPLRHYAEVHLLLEPAEAGSGLEFATSCSEQELAINWQRLVLTHLAEKEHKGVLMGAPITDMRITLIAGRAHLKHTEGGDFRQATYRALRQGLMEAESVILEPYYEWTLEVPQSVIGRAMTDLERRHAVMEPPQICGETAVLKGKAPVCTMQDYAREVAAYTKGEGRLFTSLKGYEPCHNAQEVIERAGYDPERDLENPTGSVFCAHGAGFVVPWDQVKDYMHVEGMEKESHVKVRETRTAGGQPEETWIDTEEIDAILEKTFYANRRSGFLPHKGIRSKNRKQEWDAPVTKRTWKRPKNREEYLLVDGYNIIFAWEDLHKLADANIDGARGRLLDILCNYQGIRGCQLIAVFDAYRVKGHVTEYFDYHNIHVVYTKEAETADRFIERFAHEHSRDYDVTVATSDGLEQIIIRGQGCGLLSARELREEIHLANNRLFEEFLEGQPSGKTYLLDSLDEKAAEQMKKMKEQDSE